MLSVVEGQIIKTQFAQSQQLIIPTPQVENANTLSMKCSDVYLYESSLQPDQFGSLPKLQVSPKSLLLHSMMMMTTTTTGIVVVRSKMEMKKTASIALCKAGQL